MIHGENKYIGENTSLCNFSKSTFKSLVAFPVEVP